MGSRPPGRARRLSTQSAAAFMPDVHILVVDDEPSIRRTLREILEYEDYTVDEAGDGEEALAKVRDERFDVALLDG